MLQEMVITVLSILWSVLTFEAVHNTYFFLKGNQQHGSVYSLITLMDRKNLFVDLEHCTTNQVHCGFLFTFLYSI